jgi:transcriptional regulator with XRE-family HTH domain
MHFTYVASIERGERNLGLRNIVKLARALGMDPGELTKGLRI